MIYEHFWQRNIKDLPASEFVLVILI